MNPERESQIITDRNEINTSDDESGIEIDPNSIASCFCNTPGFMSAALQVMVKNLPVKVQNRIRALKNIQLEQLNLEVEFYKEMQELEKKYYTKYQPLFNKRNEIINGDIEPDYNEEENWKTVDKINELPENLRQLSLTILNDIKPNYSENVIGVPDFWLTVFRSTDTLSELVQLHDEPVFKKLKDIKINYDNESFTLEFHFDNNKYFSNSILTKQYFYKSALDNDYPFDYEGPEIYKCKGYENDIDENALSIIAYDFKIGHFIRSRIVPKAVLYYTGDIIDEDEMTSGTEDNDEDTTDSENEIINNPDSQSIV